MYGEHDDVGGVLAAPRLFTCRELRGKRSTYINQANLTAVFSHSLGSRGGSNVPIRGSETYKPDDTEKLSRNLNPESRM